LKKHQEQLIAAGITNSYLYISPGTSHEWQTWRRSLYTFAPLLFKEDAAPAEAGDFKPSSANQPGKEYPQVDSEGRVRARIVAPEAQSVLLDIGAVKYPLTKGADGVWTGDSKPQDEGFHYYQLVIDSAQVPDPPACTSTVPAAGAVALKCQPRTRISTRSRTFLTVRFAATLLLQGERHHAAMLRVHTAGL